ncbi:MAG: hypothetical protein GWP42_07695 [Verrucomicrobiales bacterium]|nr:hypothetical protein [Verrucomicrobiales bacterium]|tara:strand:- start:682 stop:1518 length:837 start_codon:yes stop_codon:yes gene_type:complete
MRFSIILSATLFFCIALSSAQRPERLSYKGNSYQIVEIVEVKDDKASLRTTDNKTITIPVRFLSSRLRAKAENLQKRLDKIRNSNDSTSLSVVKANASETEIAIQQSIIQGTPLKRWVNGTVSNDQSDAGLVVISSVTALDFKLDREGVPLPPKKVKGSAIFISGAVMIEGAGKKPFNQHVEYIAWDTGQRIKHNGQQIPKLSLKKVEAQLLVKERTWTNAGGNRLVASLASVIDGVGNFQRSDDTEFKYPIEKLSEEDQKVINDTVKERYNELRSTL